MKLIFTSVNREINMGTQALTQATQMDHNHLGSQKDVLFLISFVYLL